MYAVRDRVDTFFRSPKHRKNLYKIYARKFYIPERDIHFPRDEGKKLSFVKKKS